MTAKFRYGISALSGLSVLSMKTADKGFGFNSFNYNKSFND